MEEAIKAKLLEVFKPTYIEVKEDGVCSGGKYAVLIVSDAFDGVALLERHRKVNAALESELKSIHALSIKAMTPAVWATKQQSS